MATLPPPTDMLQAVATHFEKAKPFFPMYAHLVVSALFPIFTGAHAALSRPSSAAKPDKQAKKKRDDDDDSDEDEEGYQQMEGMTKGDAIMFPIIAGCTLAFLFWLMKTFGKELINKIVGYYFSLVGVAAVGKLVNDGLCLLTSFIFPDWYTSAGNLWKANVREKRFDGQARIDKPDAPTRHSPLPGKYGSIDIGPSANERCWALREMLNQSYLLKATGLDIDHTIKFTLVNLFSILVGLVVILIAHFAGQIWWITNIQGFAVCYGALQIISPTSFTTASLILTGLFFYDIWAVFFTPLMESVAKDLDQPIKLVFPRPEDPNKPGQAVYSMLGLGDVVLPGMVIGMALRFDLYLFYLRKQTRIVDGQVNAKTKKLEDKMDKAEYISPRGRWSNWYWTRGNTFRQTAWGPLHDQLAASAFPKPYFTASMIGYIVGMIVTLAAMSISGHAQPALLYLVPAVLSSLWLTAFRRGEVKEMIEYTEAADETMADQDTKTEVPMTWMQTIGSWVLGLPAKKSTEDGKDSNDSDKSSNGDTENDHEANTAEDKTQTTEQPSTPTNPVIFKLIIKRIDKGKPSPLHLVPSEDSFTKFVEDGRPAREMRELVEQAFGTTPCDSFQRVKFSVWLVGRGVGFLG
ncbi:hypothetical protein MBLNU230_g1829t1 [Neophaeotheca triangularis]